MADELIVEVEGEEMLESLREEVAAHGGAMLPNPAGIEPAPLADIDVVLRHSGREVARASGRFVHVADDGKIALMFEGDDRAKMAALTLHARLPGSGEDSAEDARDEEAGEPEPEDMPLWARYETMNKAEKIKLARRGSADARRLILKDPDQSLHGHVLSNPGLSANEVAALIRSGSASTSVVNRIVERSDLMGNSRVVDALVQSPKTPVHIATRLVARIPIESARRIARSGKLRTQIVNAARKRVIKK